MNTTKVAMGIVCFVVGAPLVVVGAVFGLYDIGNAFSTSFPSLGEILFAAIGFAGIGLWVLGYRLVKEGRSA